MPIYSRTAPYTCTEASRHQHGMRLELCGCNLGLSSQQAQRNARLTNPGSASREAFAPHDRN